MVPTNSNIKNQSPTTIIWRIFLMKKLLTFSILILFSVMLSAQSQQLNSYDSAPADTNYWAFFDNHGGQHYQTSGNATAEHGWIKFSYPTDNKIEGAAAMRLDYSAQNIESWGGYTKLEHWNPDSNGVYDWSLYDTLSLSYNNVVAQDKAGRVHLRVNLQDVSDNDSYKVYDVGDCEYYYSFQYILDNEPGWHTIKIPLVNNYNWEGAGFNLTGWSGTKGNEKLDLDKIKGYSLEFSINGGGDGDFAVGSIILDDLKLVGVAARPVVFFNGAAFPSTVEKFQWNCSAELVEGAGSSTESPNAIKWTIGDAWAGFGWNVPPTNLSYHWNTDTLKFKMKAAPGIGNLRLQWEDGAAKIGANFTPISDDTWHQYKFALKDLITYYDGTANFNFEHVTVFQILTEGSGANGQVVWVDDVWTGSPTFDVLAPEAPALVSAVGGDFVNLVTWTDVPGETDEVYDVYYSLNPITDLTAKGIEVVQMGVAEGLQVVEHFLRAPKTNQDVSFYYAVVCKDAAGNSSKLAATQNPTVNTAKGVTIINPTAPANFVADGNLGEWAGITPFEINPDNGTGFIVANQKIDNATDCSAKVYLAVDSERLYVAWDVTDDIINTDQATTYLQDAPDLFIGLYDWHGPSHIGLKQGAEPDYQWRFNRASAIIGNRGDKVIGTVGVNYAWVEKFPSGYAVEGSFTFADIAALNNSGDAVFTPIVGQRIKIDMSINDADATGTREGILTYSPYNEDKSWGDVSRWLYTWIGDKMVDVKDNLNQPLTFNLNQNYPNPFNPSTQITFSIQKTSDVSLKVFNLLGQEVASLVNEVKAPGTYNVDFNASNLASGIYVYQITAGTFVSSKKMMLVK